MKEDKFSVKLFGVDTPSRSYSSFNTQLISINYLLYRNNNLSMPRQTINQWSRWREEEDDDEKENSPSCVPKMIVLLMNILSPKRLMIIHRRSPIRSFQKQTGRNWITKLNLWELVFEKLLFQRFLCEGEAKAFWFKGSKGVSEKWRIRSGSVVNQLIFSQRN